MSGLSVSIYVKEHQRLLKCHHYSEDDSGVKGLMADFVSLVYLFQPEVEL